MSWSRVGKVAWDDRLGCQVWDHKHLPVFYHRPRTSAERAGKTMSSSSVSYKKYSIQEFLSSVVRAACLHMCETQYCLVSPSVCVLSLLFSHPNGLRSFPVYPFPHRVFPAAALWSLAMCWVEDRPVSLPVHPPVLWWLLISTESLSPCVGSPPRGRRSCQSLSMSLYFLRRIETWSLNRTGSSLIWEWTSGMAPNQLANLFMQVCRWAKWSGSAQREALEDWREWRRGGKTKRRKVRVFNNRCRSWGNMKKRITSRLCFGTKSSFADLYKISVVTS